MGGVTHSDCIAWQKPCPVFLASSASRLLAWPGLVFSATFPKTDNQRNKSRAGGHGSCGKWKGAASTRLDDAPDAGLEKSCRATAGTLSLVPFCATFLLLHAACFKSTSHMTEFKQDAHDYCSLVTLD